MDPNGTPVRGSPPGAVGDVDIGVDDEARLPEPEPHIPDNPDVSGIPEVVDIPDVAEIPDDIDVPEIDIPEIDIPGADVPDIGVPDVAPVAGGAAPITIPPLS
jgi:hypothetical protein